MAFTPVPLAEKAEIIREINKIETVLRFNPDLTLVETLALPFYPGGQLLKCRKMASKGNPLWYVKLADEIVPLDGSAANINYIDAKTATVPSGDLKEQYLHFRRCFGAGKPPPQDFYFSAYSAT
jgi:hypothetical protein